MKKMLIVAIMAIMSLGAFAQKWYAGGEAGFWRNSDNNTTTFAILPEVGYNLNSKWAVGGVAGLDYTYHNRHEAFLVKVAPYLRYTFLKAGPVNLFLDGGVNLGIGVGKTRGEDADVAVTYGIGFQPGISYRLNEKFSLVAHCGFLGYRGGNNASGAPSEGGFNVEGNNLSFGFYYNF